ncbi:MAG: aminotransferase class I/II-fold pyridoxal phosphate-dependent enzyme, partial [Lactobacillus sp.]|nr:aminotransferase class I/II-fold pyridoxal phosphate-dependent enzyme [Lactobacillus sp.]
SVGDPNFTTPQPIIAAAFNQVSSGMTHYTAALGLPSLRATISQRYQACWNLPVTSDNVMVTVGAEHALFIALQAVTNPGDEIIVLEPCFSPYFDQVKLAGGKLVTVGLDADHAFAIDFAALDAALSDRTKAIIINSPNNPTGHVMSTAELSHLARWVKQHQLLVFSDEIYADYVILGYQFESFAKYAPGNTVVVSGFSKSYAMTGWRVGYLMGPKWLIAAAGQVNDAVTFSAPTPSQVAAEYALQHHDTLVAPIVHAFCKRLAYLETALNGIPNLTVSPIGGSIYAFLNIKATKLDSVNFAKQLLEQARVLVVPGLAFGASGEGFVRVAATQDLTTLKAAVLRLSQLDWSKGND